MKTYFSFKNLSILLTSLIFVLCAALPVSKVEARTITISTVTPNTTVAVGTGVSFNITTDDYVRLAYTITDTLAGSTISNSSINTAGTFSWTPLETDIGTHNLTITVTDPNGTKSTYYKTLTVTEASAVKVVSVSPGPSIFPNKGVSFGISAAGYVNPTFTLSDSFSGGSGASTISSRNIDSFGNVNWTPSDSDVGVHNLAIRVYGANGRQDVVYQTITVNGITVKDPARTDGVPLSNATAYVGTIFNFAVNLYGFTYPTYSFSDSLGNSTLDSVGINVNSFVWKPDVQDVGRHTITITASEDSNTAKAQFVVNVLPKINSSSENSTVSNTSTKTTVKENVSSTSNTKTSSGKSVYVFKKNLSVGSKGTEVSELQKKLKAEGVYNGPVNGSFGPLTKAAVIKFQGLHKISKLGNVGPATRAALNK